MWYEKLALIHVSLLTKSAVKKVFVPDLLKASAATRLLLLLIFQCHNIAHARPCFLHFSHSPLLPLKIRLWQNSSKSQSEPLSLQARRFPVWPLRLVLRPATSPPQAMKQPLTTLSHQRQGRPAGQQSATELRGQSEAAICIYTGGKQSYKALIIRGGERQRGIWKERERPGVGKRQGWRSIPCNGRQGQRQGQGTQPGLPNCTSRLLNLRPPATFLKLAKK